MLVDVGILIMVSSALVVNRVVADGVVVPVVSVVAIVTRDVAAVVVELAVLVFDFTAGVVIVD